MTRRSLPCTAKAHGTASAYNWHGCRCPQARAEHTAQRRARRRAAGVPPAPATVPARRYVALLREMLTDHTQRDLADRLGWAPGRLSKLLLARRMQEATAARVEELYALLTGRRVRGGTWVDPARVLLAVGGGVPWKQLNAGERLEAVVELRRLGCGAALSGARLGVSYRTVQRWRARAARAA